MCNDAPEVAARSRQATREELLKKLAASRARRAVLREQVHEALSRLEQLSRGSRR